MTLSDLQSGLQASRGALFDAVHGMSEEQFRFAPSREVWCIATHLAHLLRIERLFVERARAALAQDSPLMPSTRVANDDDPRFAQKLAVPQIVHGMQAARRDLDALLDRCDVAALDRAIIHERLGRMTVAEIAAKMAAHEQEHTAEITHLARHVPASARVIIPLAQRS